MSAVLSAREPSAKYLVASRPSLIRDLELFATAPAAFTKLRELILVFAVRGNIVKQRSEDEPASSLIAKIEKEKIRLISEKRLRNRSELPSISEAEHSFSLPVGWVWSRLGNLGDWGAGATPSRSRGDYYGGDIPWFKSGELTGDSIGQSEETVTQLALKECSLRLNHVGDVLVAMYAATIGKTAILAKVGTTNQAVCACTPFSGLDKRYLLLLLKALRPYFVSIAAGGAQPNISREKLIATVVGLPPLAEQHRIVTRVEELMKLCDALEARGRLADVQHARLTSTLFGALVASESDHALAENWQRIAEHFDLLLDRPEAIDALEQTILQLAVRGRLVPQIPSDESGASFLAKLHGVHISKPSQLDEPAQALTRQIPRGWIWCRLESITKVGTGTTPSRTNLAYFDPAEIPWVTSGETSQPYVAATGQHVSALALRETSLKLYPPGTLIVAMYGQGKTRGQITELKIAATTNQACAAIVPIEPAIHHRRYLKLFFEKSYDELRLQSAGGAQPNLNVGKIKATLIPLPPLAEQHRIVARVEELRHLCAQLRERLTSARRTQSQLAEALVAEVA